MKKTRILVVSLALAAGLAVAGVAYADAPAGNSGHSSNGSTQCQSDGQTNPNCPPFGTDK